MLWACYVVRKFFFLFVNIMSSLKQFSQPIVRMDQRQDYLLNEAKKKITENFRNFHRCLELRPKICVCVCAFLYLLCLHFF